MHERPIIGQFVGLVIASYVGFTYNATLKGFFPLCSFIRIIEMAWHPLNSVGSP
jgi:hypothetical protein